MAITDQKMLQDWDEAGALKRINGNAVLLRKLLAIYLTSSDQMLADIEAAVKEENRARISEIAHALKGIAGNLSANRVAHFAQEVEALAPGASWEDLNAPIQKLNEASEDIVSIFTARLEAVP